MIHALSREGIARIDAILARKPLLAFDIDGTLAPIVSQPGEARLPDAIQRCLDVLASRSDMAIITGRAAEDARSMLAFTPRYVVGNHGAEGVPAWAGRRSAFVEIVRDWHDALRACSPLVATGVMIEDKRYSLSLHYRQAPDWDAAYRAIRDCIERLRPTPKVIDGKAVVNLLTPDAPNKGDALRALIADSVTSAAIYVGDDDTDERVFELILPDVLTIRVERDDASRAALFLHDQGEVLPLLRHIADREQALR
ncbi:MAG TPA: trehalose-phosphatase [Casimicrobiaceae bacterium]|nr:trehalose-phosphatase [Thermoanaerobaculia bacterium]HLX26921.1 trehalose-phosphatase [Casimicrobiaceae bacterium]